MTTADVAKFNMIEQQIRPWEVIDGQVLDVIDRLDRESNVLVDRERMDRELDELFADLDDLNQDDWIF